MLIFPILIVTCLIFQGLEQGRVLTNFACSTPEDKGNLSSAPVEHNFKVLTSFQYCKTTQSSLILLPKCKSCCQLQMQQQQQFFSLFVVSNSQLSHYVTICANCQSIFGCYSVISLKETLGTTYVSLFYPFCMQIFELGNQLEKSKLNLKSLEDLESTFNRYFENKLSIVLHTLSCLTPVHLILQ